VGRKPPQAFILSPETGVTVTAGAPLWLHGYAYDLEDGTLGGSALRWTSSLDGDLGTGSQVLVALSIGHHTITLQATDSSGMTVMTTIDVVATPGFFVHRYLPVILRD